MDDTIASGGRALDAVTSIRVEYVSPTSQLVGDSLNQITIRLRTIGSPTGFATVGVFDSAGNTKKVFGTIDVNTALSSSYADYSFSISNQTYTIQSGDRIGIKYTGGTSTNYINVVVDSDGSDPFDGINSYRQWYTTSWQSYVGEDMYMILQG
jgi:hypothetical protein